MPNPNDAPRPPGGSESSPLMRSAWARLVGAIGLVAALGVTTQIPRLESGRTVEVTVDATGTVPTVTHLSGRQYLRAYLDSVGVATACDGMTRNVRMGQTYTEEQCAVFLIEDLAEHAEGMMRCTPGLRPERLAYQRMASVLLTYNIGVGGWCRSTPRRLFNAGSFRAACDFFPRYNMAGGRVERGLVTRRAYERRVCLTELPT